MKLDPIVEEIRDIRHKIDRECQENPEKYYEHVKDFQQKLGARLVCRKPTPLTVVLQKKTG
ncbi:hypothetical protein HYY27_07905 [bacterium]|nr:hypothetical protein [bacterium]